MSDPRTPGRFRIRQAGLEDMTALATMRAQAWRESHDLPEEEFLWQERAIAATAERWEQQAHEGHYFWAVTDAAEPERGFVGVAHAAISTDPDAPTPLELRMIYLLERAKGSGVADRLVQMAIGEAPAFLWVLEGNDRAVAFHRRHGFVEDGTRVPLGRGVSNRFEMRMVRSSSQ